MPEYYSSIGEAVAAAMAHNIQLAHRGVPAPRVEPPVHAAGSAGGRRTPRGGRLTKLDPDTNLADRYGTDIVIFHWEWQSIWADTRTGISQTAHQVLEELGFVEASYPGAHTSHELAANRPWPEHQSHCTRAAGTLVSAGFTVILDPDLDTDLQVPDVIAHYRPSLPDAAARTSPIAADSDAALRQQPAAPVAPPATSAVHHTR